MGTVTYEVQKADTVKELENIVNARLAKGAILEGGAFSVAIIDDNQEIRQTFLQAVTHEDEEQ